MQINEKKQQNIIETCKTYLPTGYRKQTTIQRNHIKPEKKSKRIKRIDCKDKNLKVYSAKI